MFKKRSATGGELPHTNVSNPHQKDSSGGNSNSKGFPSEVLNNPADLTSQEDEDNQEFTDEQKAKLNTILGIFAGKDKTDAEEKLQNAKTMKSEKAEGFVKNKVLS
jgi:hypothetical protein